MSATAPIFAQIVSAANFPKDYPAVERVVLDNKRVVELGLTYSQLGDPISGWESLSEAYYGNKDFASELKSMNGNVESPMDVQNGVQKFFCDITDKYCAPVINIRTRPLKPEKPAPSASTSLGVKTAKAEPNKPIVLEPKPNVEVVEAPVEAPTAPIVILSPNHLPAGVEGPLTIKVQGKLEAEGTITAAISPDSQVIIRDYGLEKVDGRTVRVPVDLSSAVPGTYAITVKIGESAVGAAKFTVDPAVTE